MTTLSRFRMCPPEAVILLRSLPAPSPGTSSSGQSWRGNGVLPRIRVETERFVHAVGILGGYVVADRPAAVARAAFGPLLQHQELSFQLHPAPLAGPCWPGGGPEDLSGSSAIA